MRNADRKKKQIEKEKQYATIIGLQDLAGIQKMV